MEYIYIAIIPFIVTLLLPIAFTHTQKQARESRDKLNSENFTMQASKSFSILFMLMTFFLMISILLLNLIDSVSVATNVVLCLVVLGMSCGCLQSFRQKIIITGDLIVYTPTVGKTKRFYFSDITKVKKINYSRGLILYNVYNDKKIFKFSNQAKGYFTLLELFNKKKIKIEEK